MVVGKMEVSPKALVWRGSLEHYWAPDPLQIPTVSNDCHRVSLVPLCSPHLAAHYKTQADWWKPLDNGDPSKNACPLWENDLVPLP